MLGQVLIGLLSGAAYALVAVGVVLIYKSTRALSLAQGEIGAFGYFYALRWAALGMPLTDWHPTGLWMLIVAAVIGMILGAVVERVIMRPLIRRPPLDAVIATLGVALFLALLEKQIFGTDITNTPSAVGSWSLTVADVTLDASRVVALGLTVAVAFAAFLFLSRSRFGLAVRATTGNPSVARLMGIPVNRVYRFAWMTAGALAGAAAALLGPAFGGIQPFTMTQYGLRALAGAVIGGLDSIWGAIVGCLLVGVVEGVTKSQFTTQGADQLAVLLLVIGTLVLRPQGLLGAEAAG
ncbi:MAG: branched-chain amino acid ABC transporter permease [Acidimicrobiia bacterium]